MTTAVLDKLCELHELQKHESFFLALGKKSIILGEKDLDVLQGKGGNASLKAMSWRKYVPFLGKDKKKEKESEQQAVEYYIVGKDFNKKKPVFITEENIRSFVFPSCCHPIPGDDILGYIDNKKRIEIHKRVCPIASKLKSSFGNRILDAKWDMHKQLFFNATIEIRGIDRKGLLFDVSKIISDKLDINIQKITVSGGDGIFEGYIEIKVHDRDEVRIIMENLKQIKDLQEVQQIM